MSCQLTTYFITLPASKSSSSISLLSYCFLVCLQFWVISFGISYSLFRYGLTIQKNLIRPPSPLNNRSILNPNKFMIVFFWFKLYVMWSFSHLPPPPPPPQLKLAPPNIAVSWSMSVMYLNSSFKVHRPRVESEWPWHCFWKMHSPCSLSTLCLSLGRRCVCMQVLSGWKLCLSEGGECQLCLSISGFFSVFPECGHPESF